MFTKISRYYSLKILYNYSMRYFSNNYQESIPYNFSGFDFDSELSSTLLQSKQTKSLIDIYLKNAETGFLYAYDNLIDAIITKDLKFLRLNLEEKFFKNIKDYPENLEEKNLILEIVENPNLENEVFYQVPSIIIGAYINRNSNSIIMEKKIIKNKPFKLTFCFNGEKTRNLNTIIQIPLVIKSKKTIILRSEVADVEKTKSGVFHKLVFEIEISRLNNFAEKLLPNFFKKEKTDNLADQEPESRWKISDIDDFMGGNEFSLLKS